MAPLLWKAKVGVYAVIGVFVEVVFWAVWVFCETGDFRLHGCSHLWACIIYGLAIGFIDHLSQVDAIRTLPLGVRGVLYTMLIYTWELSTGLILIMIIGACPWDYSGYTKYNYLGIITFDYCLFWMMGSLAAEQFLIPALNSIEIRPVHGSREAPPAGAQLHCYARESPPTFKRVTRSQTLK